MMALVERIIALRYLRARKAEGFVSFIALLSLLGIALGVGTLIVVMSVMNGFRSEMYNLTLGIDPHLWIVAEKGKLKDYDRIVAGLNGLPGVVNASAVIRGEVMVQGGKKKLQPAQLRGITPLDLRQRPMIAGRFTQGSDKRFGQGATAVIGSGLAYNLGVSLLNATFGRGGDESHMITLLAPRSRTDTALAATVPQMQRFQVAGIFHAGLHKFDNNFVYIPLEAAQRFLKTGDEVSGIEVMVEDPKNIEIYLEDIAALAGPGVKLVDWRKANHSLFAALQVERVVMFIILTLIVVVAAFNIISSMVMLVKNKSRSIAILRTMGASRGMITRIFFFTGSTIGVFGTLAGFGLGVGIASNIKTLGEKLRLVTHAVGLDNALYAEIEFLSSLPSLIDWTEVAIIVVLALLLTVLATLYPSWRAARIDPVEGLRYE